MFFNFPVDILVSGYKMVVNFYLDFRIMQHLILFIILIWWFTHPNTGNKRFISGYLSFTFLGLTGAMGHAVEMLEMSNYRVSIYFKLGEIILFILFFITLIGLIRGKSVLKLPIGFLKWISLIFIIIVFWYIDKYKCPQGYIFKFFERISFILCISTLVNTMQGTNVYHLPRKIWRWWLIIPLVAGILYPWDSMDKLKTIIFSPYGLLPSPTLIVAISLMSLSEQTNNVTTWIITLAGLYFGLIGWIKLKIFWDIFLVAVSLYALILLLVPIMLKERLNQ